MLFNTPQFFLFLLVVLVLHYLLPRPARKYLLLLASYYFYICWNVKFIALLLTLTVLDYSAALLMAPREGARRRAVLLASLAANLGFLGFFKYYNFFAANLAALFHLPPNAGHLDILLPIGISFHTFQSMSYVIDVYRREQEPVRHPIDYALFIAFFPQLVAGPIVRARDFFKDLAAWQPPTALEAQRGLLLVLFGLTKKVALADQFAQIADRYFQNIPAHPGALAAWSGLGSFALQIFFDFSGYTDMAIGLALLFGFHFPENFRRPYLAQSITEFWRRWHISLSNWLRDYLWFPLGASRRGPLFACRNLMCTMLLGGLWHGASWNSVIWGGWHGALLSAESLAGVHPGRHRFPALAPLRVLATWLAVALGWVFFRARTLPDSLAVLRALFSGPAGSSLAPRWLFWFAILTLALALLEERFAWFERLARAPAWLYACALALLLFTCELIGVTEIAVPFVYFQF